MTEATLATTPLQGYREQFERFAANGGGAGPSWLLPIREAALDRFGALGFPTMKNEDWHFTSVAPIAERRFQLPESAHGVTAADVERFSFAHPEWTHLVFVNGCFAPELSDTTGLPKGVEVHDLASALRDEPRRLERYLTKLAGYEQQAFTALNTAFMESGAVVHLAANAEVPSPIHLIFVTDDQAAERMVHPRNLIVAEHHARATVVESYVSLGDTAHFTNAVTEVSVADGAQVTHYKMQRESTSAYHVGTVDVRQARDSRFVSFSLALGAALSRTNIYTVLDGEGSEAVLHGLYMVNGTQHVDHQTRIEHAEPNCASHEVYKGIIDDRAHGVFNGKVYVRPEAQKTDGKQENANLLLSEHARVDTKPQLEIFADDVKCTHGATVGRLDELSLFYMKSRGISAEHARALLTYAFAAGVLEQIEIQPIREQLEALALARFTRDSGLGTRDSAPAPAESAE